MVKGRQYSACTARECVKFNLPYSGHEKVKQGFQGYFVHIHDLSLCVYKYQKHSLTIEALDFFILNQVHHILYTLHYSVIYMMNLIYFDLFMSNYEVF